MKAISLWNPWATLLAHGLKSVETRGWHMSHRGPLLVHAAKKWDGRLSDLCVAEPFRSALDLCGIGTATRLPFGAIIGVVEVVDCVPVERVEVDPLGVINGFTHQDLDGRTWLTIDETERAFGDYTARRYAILCRNARAFREPVPCKGQQMLWEIPDELVAAQLAEPEVQRG